MSTGTGTAKSPQDENLELLKQILEQLRISNVKLYGNSDADEEHSTGRLPKVEHSSLRAHLRIDKIEKKIIYVSGMATAIGVAVGTYVQILFHK